MPEHISRAPVVAPPDKPPEKAAGVKVKQYGSALMAPEDHRKLTLRKVAGYLLDAVLVVALPAGFMLAFGLWQMALPEQIYSSASPAQYKLAFKSLTLRTADGYDLAAWDVQPATPSEDAILVLSGYAADKGSILPRTAFLGQTHRLLYLDFRSFGASTGNYSTMGLREVEDAMAGIRYLKEQGVKRIGIYGFTMGGAVALMAAAREPAVSAVVTEDAYADLGIVAGDPYGYLGPAQPIFGWCTEQIAKLLFGIDPDAVSPAAVAPAIEAPMLIVHSRADISVPFIHADILRGRLKEKKNATFWYTNGNASLAARTEFARRLLEFFGTNLSAPAPVPTAEDALPMP